MIRRYFENAIIALTILGALTSGTVVVRHWLILRQGGLTADSRIIRDADSYSAHGFVRGPESARHTLVVFSDFECPSCREFAPILDALHTRYPDVRIVERNWPLKRHPFARRAALAAACAGTSGHHEEMRHALFSHLESIKAEQWGKLAQAALVPDTADLAACVRSARLDRVIDEDVEAAKRLGAIGTPAVLVDSILFGHIPTLKELSVAVTRK